MDILQIAAELGAPCLLALVIFFMYRRDVRNHIKWMNRIIERDQHSREKNTEALTELTTYLKMKNGNSKKRGR